MDGRPAPAFVAVSTNPAIDRVARIEGGSERGRRRRRVARDARGQGVHAACVAAELGAETRDRHDRRGQERRSPARAARRRAARGRRRPGRRRRRGGPTRWSAPRGRSGRGPRAGRRPDRGGGRRARLRARRRSPPVPHVVAVCGSLPPGAPTDLHARLVATARELGAFTILDCSTPEALAAALAEGPDLVAPNLAEAAALLGAGSTPRPATASSRRSRTRSGIAAPPRSGSASGRREACSPTPRVASASPRSRPSGSSTRSAAATR